MAIPTEVIMQMATLGLNEKQARVVADMLTAVEAATLAVSDAGKEKARARWRKWKERDSTNVSKRLPTTANDSKQLAHVEDKTLTTVIEPQDKKASRTHGDVDAFRAGLAPDVSEDMLEEFIKVRRKKRGALTAIAAKLFREDAGKCGMSVAEAVKECVRSSWITVKPEYFQNRQRAGPQDQIREKLMNSADNLSFRLEQADGKSAGQIEGNQALVGYSGLEAA